MPNFKHETPLRVFQTKPAVAGALLRMAFGKHLPDFATVEPSSEALTDVRPVELNCDSVQICRDTEGEIVFAVIIEVQNRPAVDKPYGWIAYMANLERRLKCNVALLVFCPDRRTAAWAKNAGCDRLWGLEFFPQVVGPEEVPEARNRREGPYALAETVVSVLIHHDSPWRPQIIETLEAELRELSQEEAIEYANEIFPSFDEADSETIRMVMMPEVYPFHRALVGDSYETIKAEGKAEREANLVLRLLTNRSVAVTDDQRERIESCTDLDQLDEWFDRAMVVTDAAEMFDQSSGEAAAEKS
ncbi:hypothetical protein [Natronoglycomyces albus]|uniref:Transposase (putative) YhgA-like domain-containing protein n=1 Tax=Natronoglycomyces albus TaxID=2811108 RepID=A0A895XQ73_9ACTN|nr:hypothetical protein [Natronoglycomyces albus]QSB05275.1 hypothetical protein JQS30_16230 [Natronoglycomyces albus]